MNPLVNMMGGNEMLRTIANMKRMMAGQDPNTVMRMMAQRNPQFAQFVDENKGKSPEQIAKEYGIDWNMIKGMMK